jgi:methionine sulfoxide reductase heme-binding subunit
MSALPLAATLLATWVLTRGSGAVSLLLLSATLVLGIVDVTRWRARSLPRFVIDALHRNVALLAVAFVGVHVFTTLIDRFVSIGVVDAVVPFAGSYKPLWLGLGAIGFDLLLALIATSLLRQRFGYRAWRATHWLAYACWPVAMLHAIGMGTDASQPWMLALVLVCGGAVAVAVVTRLALSGSAADRPAKALVR